MTADTQQATASPPTRLPLCFTARIKLVGAGRFRLDPAGELAQIATGRDRLDMVDDQIAWLAGTPGRWYALDGVTPILGARELALAASWGDPIAIHSTPAAWVEAHGEGVCVLDWQSTLASCFEGIPEITTAHLDPATAREIEKRLKRNFWRGLPRVGGHRGR